MIRRWCFRVDAMYESPPLPPPATNILFILIDDLGWKDLGTYGSDFYETPNLDRLATDGMSFSDAYASCPVCSPTRASCLTGRYPARVGVMPRGAPGAAVRWFNVDPCYVFHPMNSYDEGGTVVMDTARYPELWRADSADFKNDASAILGNAASSVPSTNVSVS